MPVTSRDPWLDNTKMVLVTLVVVGHSWGLLAGTDGKHWAYDFLYFWHIPAFVVVSGYLSKSFAWDRRHLLNLVYTLLVPYLIFEPALYYYRVAIGEREPGLLYLQPHWTMWYLVVLMLWRLATPILKMHWIFVPGAVVVGVAGGLWNTDLLMIPRFLGLLPFFVLGLHLKPYHLKRLDDPWVRLASLPALLLIGLMARYTDAWATTAFLWYDAGYEDIGVDPVIAFQTRLTIMAIGLIGAFSVLSLVPRRNLGWFTAMGGATMVVYLFHGFVVKTAKALGWSEWTGEHVVAGFLLTTVGAVVVALVLASPPVRRVLGVAVDPVRSWQRHRAAARERQSGPQVGGTAERGTES